jgi:hypothetical protein
MDPNSYRLFVGAAAQQGESEQDPEIGAAYEGGFYAGKIRYQGIIWYLIVAPRATGASGTGYTVTTNYRLKTTNDTTVGSLSSINGAGNTGVMTSTSALRTAHPAANFCWGLSIGGFSDWYLPARLELDVAYENLKPTTASNQTSWGINEYAIPPRTSTRTAGTPAQTSVTAFQSGGAEPFVDSNHWSSTETNATTGALLNFSTGVQNLIAGKTGFNPVRAFRRVISPIQVDELNPLGLIPGDALEGGLFAGYISHTADGVPTHALIMAPRATGASGTDYTLTTNYQWKTADTTTTGTTSPFDGAANTAAMVTAGINDHPAAKFCVDLSIGGYSDWYLPARFELDIAYYHLKPTTASNSTSWGINNYSVPERTANNTAGDPAQTSVTAFKDTGSEPFVAVNHWSSTEDSSTNAWRLVFAGGSQGSINKTSSFRVRAFRKLAL